MSATPPPTRRALVALASAVAMAPIAALVAYAQKSDALAAQPHPDAGLLAAIAAFDALQAEIDSHYCNGSAPIEDDDERDIVNDPVRDEQRPLVDVICTLRATTPEGGAARARSLAAYDPGLLRPEGGENGYCNERLVAALLRDLAAIGGQA